jgi:hypothetical protein
LLHVISDIRGTCPAQHNRFAECGDETSRYIIAAFFLASCGEVRPSPLTGLVYQPRMTDDECGAVSGIRIGRGNPSTRRKASPVPFCQPQIPHNLGSNPGRCGVKPATNRLSYCTAQFLLTCCLFNDADSNSDYSVEWLDG